MVKINPHSHSQTTSPSSAESTQVKGKWALPFMRKVKRLHPFSDDEVRAKAHQLWLKRGGGEGEEKKDWERAIKALKWERSLLGRTQKLFQLAWSVDNPKDAIEVIKLGISALGLAATIFAGVGLYLTYQNGQEERRLNTERLMTDRFAKAVEQLGSKESNVRIGAIYSLERIAKDSPKDYWTVMEVLTAYVRERSRLPKGWIDTPPNKRKELDDVTTDVQSVLTVIGRRNSENDSRVARLDLASTNLFRANLDGANLYYANLKDANLYGANLWYANLSNANLSNANLKDANLSVANLYYANLDGANLMGANLYGASLRGANLMGADLRGADLSGAYLFNADLTGARNWTDKQLSQADLCNTRLPYGSQLDPNRDCKKFGTAPDSSLRPPKLK